VDPCPLVKNLRGSDFQHRAHRDHRAEPEAFNRIERIDQRPESSPTRIEIPSLWSLRSLRLNQPASISRFQRSVFRRGAATQVLRHGKTSPFSAMTPDHFLSQAYQGRKVIITGGLGFIGSNLARALVDLGAEVTLVTVSSRNTVATAQHRRSGTKGHRQHFRCARPAQPAGVLTRQGFSLQPGWADQPYGLDERSRDGSGDQLPVTAFNSRDLSPVHPGIRVVFASTRQIYGRPDYLPVDEKHPSGRWT